RANAARGFRALSFPEFPAQMKLPSPHSRAWDPLWEACAETGTVVCLHTGSASWAPIPSPDPPFELYPTVFPGNAFLPHADSTWPESQQRMQSRLGHLSDNVVAKLTHENAEKLFRWQTS